MPHDYQIALSDAQRDALRDHVRHMWTSVSEEVDAAVACPHDDTAVKRVAFHTAVKRMTLHVRVCAAIIDGEVVLDDPMRGLIAYERAELAAYLDEQREHLSALQAGDPGAVLVAMSREVSEAATLDVIERCEVSLAALDELLAAA